MPKIVNNQIIWDAEDWLGGFDQTSATTLNKKGLGIAGAQRVDPMRDIGYIAPGFSPVNATNASAVTSVILNGVVKGSSAYAIGNDSSFYQITSLNIGTVTNAGAWPHTIAHGGHTSIAGYDVINYYVGTAIKTFYSFSDSSDWDIGAYDHTGATFTDNYMSVTAATPLAAPYLAGGASTVHPLIVGDDDIMYIGDRNFVHAFDGQTGAAGTFTPAVLTLPQGWTITAFAKTTDFKLAIAAYFTTSVSGSTYNQGEAKIFMWDYISLDPYYIYNLHDNYVTEVVNWRGTLVAFTQGRLTLAEPNLNKFQVLNNGIFTVLGTYNSGSAPVRGGVEVVNNDIYWNASGKIYTYGEVPGTSNYILNSPFGGADGNSGMLRVFSSALNFMFSYASSTSGGLLHASSATYADSSVLDVKVAYPFTNSRKRARLKSVTMRYKAAVTNANARQISLSSTLDKATSYVIFQSTPTVSMSDPFFLNYDGTPLGDFTSLSFEVIWGGGSDSSACPVIESIVAEFEEINN